MFKNIDAILFDLDGTLLDSAPDLGFAADKMRLDRGLPSHPPAHYRPYASSGARGMIYAAFGVAPTEPEFEALKNEFLTNYDACLIQNTTAFDGVPELIANLVKQDLRWGVVTNKSERFTKPLTQSMPLFDSASTIVSGDTTPHPKPHPAPLLEAARQLGLAPERCLYVGDDERDIQAGRAAGMPTVIAAYGYLAVSADTGSWHADASIDSPTQLMNLLSDR